MSCGSYHEPQKLMRMVIRHIRLLIRHNRAVICRWCSLWNLERKWNAGTFNTNYLFRLRQHFLYKTWRWFQYHKHGVTLNCELPFQKGLLSVVCFRDRSKMHCFITRWTGHIKGQNRCCLAEYTRVVQI